MSAREYDVIVIGAGSVGENVADYAQKGGLTAVVVEAELVGGECSYWACMPSKGLLRPHAVLEAARDVRGAAGAITGGVDPVEVFARRDTITNDWNDDSQVRWLDSVGIDLVRGQGRLTGVKTVRVEATDGTVTELVARHAVVVSTGSAALLPDVPGLREARPWTSRDATSATHVPGRLAVIGGGVVATEMATAYTGLGSQVTVLVRGDGLLAGQEPFAGEAVRARLEKNGAAVRTGVETTSARRTDSGAVELTLSDGSTLEADEVLVAVGRVAHTQDVGMEAVGLVPGDWLTVDDTLRVDGFDWLYATGDVNHRALLTHQGKYQARAAGRVIAARANGATIEDAPWGEHVATADHEVVPQVTFTEPEVASVGLTAAAAEKAGYRTRVVDYDMSYLAGTYVHADHYEGTARMVVDEDRGVLLGVTFVGQDVSELLQAATIAIVGQVPLHRLWHAVPAYPTINEIWLRLLETYAAEPAE